MRVKDLADRAPLLIRFGYDGARFHGLQPQAPGTPTAGDALRERLSAAFGRRPSALNFAARTDTGVHALKNLATCYFRPRPDAGELERALCALAAARDDGLVDVRAGLAPATVHARGSSRGKRYRYALEDGDDGEDGARRPWVWAIAPRLDVERMRAAAVAFVSTRDFGSLRGGADDGKDAVKTLASVRVGGPFAVPGTARRRFVVEVCGTGFLRKMMRNLVGLLVEVGTGWRGVDDVERVLAARSRQAAGLCAPPQGLTLMEVGCSWPDDGSGLVRELRALSTP